MREMKNLRIESETKIYETRDYGMFKKHSQNVPLDERHLIKIMESIKKKNLLHLEPIIVDSEYRVVDGQHRLEAAKRLELSIFYIIAEDSKPEDMRQMNISRTWKREHYLHNFVECGFPEYIKLKKFMDKTGLSLKNVFVIWGIEGRGRANLKRDDFRDGNFKCPSLDKMEISLLFLAKCNKVIDYVKERIEGKKDFLRTPTFLRALYVFLSLESVNFDFFMKKLPYKLNLIRPQARVIDFVNIFRQIYNYKNPKPIEIDGVE
jgi:hypothetical protein